MALSRISSFRMHAVSTTFVAFPARAGALGERANDGIAARRHERAHIEDGADLGAPAPDGARPSPRPAVPIQGGHPHQRGDLFAGQRAEFRQRRQQRRRQHRPDAGRAPQSASFSRHTGLS